ncbi:hypothetical protein CCFV1_ORF085 [Cotesia congregata filamentous virus 1]|uniref:Uncharacterized protein n=1 Tax=Cotesia congregata filamentous virus 1 TaxID=3064291 RepID=A0ABC8QK86_9VIRU|nr:hypothetical protein CCFV1_ORF085 [Cotesia congregata filamentous virus 1]
MANNNNSANDRLRQLNTNLNFTQTRNKAEITWGSGNGERFVQQRITIINKDKVVHTKYSPSMAAPHKDVYVYRGSSGGGPRDGAGPSGAGRQH